MKKLLSILLLFVCQLLQSQTVPQGINYQAVALDQRGQPIPGIDIVGRPIDDAEIGVRIAILENTPTGNILYQEEHEVLTDLYGMFNLVIGQGLQVSVDPFSSINWQGDKFLQVELSIENDGEFVLSAVQQLMSVPYAFLAENAMVAQTAVDVDDADADPSNEIQTLSKSGSIISLTNGGNVTVFDGNYNNLSNTPIIPSKTSDLTNDSGFLTTEVDGSTTNELQVLSLSNDTIYLTSGGYVVLPAGFDGDYSSLTNTPSIPSKTSDLTNDSGFITAEVDGSTSNELQLLSISNDTIYLSDGGFVKLPAGFDGAYSSLTGAPSLPTKTSDLTNDSGFITAEVDGSITNEIQTLSKSGSTIFLTQGGSVTVFDGDYNSLSNTPTVPIKTSDLTNDSGFITSEVDGSTTNELQVLTISNDTIFLSNGGFVKLPSSSSNNYITTTIADSIVFASYSGYRILSAYDVIYDTIKNITDVMNYYIQYDVKTFQNGSQANAKATLMDSNGNSLKQISYTTTNNKTVPDSKSSISFTGRTTDTYLVIKHEHLSNANNLLITPPTKRLFFKDYSNSSNNVNSVSTSSVNNLFDLALDTVVPASNYTFTKSIVLNRDNEIWDINSKIGWWCSSCSVSRNLTVEFYQLDSNQNTQPLSSESYYSKFSITDELTSSGNGRDSKHRWQNIKSNQSINHSDVGGVYSSYGDGNIYWNLPAGSEIMVKAIIQTDNGSTGSGNKGSWTINILRE